MVLNPSQRLANLCKSVESVDRQSVDPDRLNQDFTGNSSKSKCSSHWRNKSVAQCPAFGEPGSAPVKRVGTKMKSTIWFAALVLGIGLLPQHVTANPIPPGGIASPVPAADESGPLVADTGLVPYSFAANTGTVREIVVEDSLNPWGAGDLTFIYQVHVSAGEIGRLTGSDYTGFLTDVSQHAAHPPLITTSTHPADLATRSADGSVVGFDFITAIAPEPAPTDFTTDTSLALLVRTNATSFTTGTIGLIDGGGDTLGGFAPTSLPAPLAVWGGLGLLGLLAFGRFAKFKRSVA